MPRAAGTHFFNHAAWASCSRLIMSSGRLPAPAEKARTGAVRAAAGRAKPAPHQHFQPHQHQDTRGSASSQALPPPFRVHGGGLIVQEERAWDKGEGRCKEAQCEVAQCGLCAHHNCRSSRSSPHGTSSANNVRAAGRSMVATRANDMATEPKAKKAARRTANKLIRQPSHHQLRARRHVCQVIFWAKFGDDLDIRR